MSKKPETPPEIRQQANQELKKSVEQVKAQARASVQMIYIENFENKLKKADLLELLNVHDDLFNMRKDKMRSKDIINANENISLKNIIEDEFDLNLLNLLHIETINALSQIRNNVDDNSILENSKYKNLLNFIKHIYAKLLSADQGTRVNERLKLDYKIILSNYYINTPEGNRTKALN